MSGMRRLLFLTHAEVRIDPDIPVTDWGLSDQGHQRHAAFAQDPCLAKVTSIYASTERKAVEGAMPVAVKTGLSVQQIKALGENDRRATGYLEFAEFERTADAFFAQPDQSIRGWETARAAQHRITSAIADLVENDTTSGDILIVSHGAVGALLRCDLLGCEITRAQDQASGGGNCFWLSSDMTSPPTEWRSI